MLVHTLKPIDAVEAYQSFYDDYQNLLAKLQASKDAKADMLGASVIATVPPQTAALQAPPSAQMHPGALVSQFASDERYSASRKLVELYKAQPQSVIEALVGGIQPPSFKTSYRVNLYVAFTLARIEPHWTGTQSQFDSVSRLKSYREYGEPTFYARVEEALKNFRLAK